MSPTHPCTKVAFRLSCIMLLIKSKKVKTFSILSSGLLLHKIFTKKTKDLGIFIGQSSNLKNHMAPFLQYNAPNDQGNYFPNSKTRLFFILLFQATKTSLTVRGCTQLNPSILITKATNRRPIDNGQKGSQPSLPLQNTLDTY